MNGMTRLALAAAAVVAVVVGGLYVLRPGADRPGVGGPGSPVPSASTSLSPPPSATTSLLDTSTWVAYESDRYGFSIGHPADWTERASDHVWTLAADSDWLSPASEGFRAADSSVYATAWSVSVPAGTTAEAWIAAYCVKQANTPCTGIPGFAMTATMDGHPGLLVPFKDDTQAFFLVDSRMYVVAVWEPDSDPRTAPYGGAQRLLKGYLASMRLLPGGPALPTSARPS
jgi:hypothetical protein